MGNQMSICSDKGQTVAEDDTFQYTGSRFIIPNKIDFSTQYTFTRIERTAKEFCRMNKINDFYFPLISRMIAYRHQRIFQAAWARITSEQRIGFLDSLIEVPHELMDSFYHHYFQKIRILKKSIKNILVYSPKELLIEPPKCNDAADELKNIGKKILLNNKVAVFFMCAGYSSRFEKEDKFLAPIDSFGKVNILDLLFLRLRRNGASKQIHIIINCNEVNIDIVRRHVSKKRAYGFDGNNIKFLVNFSLPIFDKNGQYCLDENSKIVKRSSGTANAVQQILSNNLYGCLQGKGVQYAFISGAENIMENPCDPMFMGKMLEMERNVAIKCVKPIYQGQNLARIGLDSSHNLRIIDGDVLNQLSDNVRNHLPIPMNSIFFKFETLKKAARDYSILYSMAQNYQVIQIQQKILNYETNQVLLNTCFNFQKDIRNLITCIRDPLLYKSNRMEEYAPILSKNKEYSLVKAQQYFRHKIQQQIYQLNI